MRNEIDDATFLGDTRRCSLTVTSPDDILLNRFVDGLFKLRREARHENWQNACCHYHRRRSDKSNANEDRVHNVEIVIIVHEMTMGIRQTRSQSTHWCALIFIDSFQLRVIHTLALKRRTSFRMDNGATLLEILLSSQVKQRCHVVRPGSKTRPILEERSRG